MIQSVNNEYIKTLTKLKQKKYREETKDIAKCEEDVLSYALFPQVAEKFFKTRDAVVEEAADNDEVVSIYVEDLS